MNASRFHASPAFIANATLLTQLHDLIREGQGDSEKADTLRDEMDVHWRRLSADEREQIRGLSADLSSIGQAEPEAACATSAARIPSTFVDAVQRGEWQQVLRILRDHQTGFPAAELAWLRGACWAHLGQPVVAILFFEERARIRPLKPEEEVWLLTCQIQAKGAADVLPRAEEIAQNESEPVLLLKAAEILSVRASEVEGDQVEALRKAAIETAQRGLRLAKNKAGDELLAVLAVAANLHLALDYEALGRIDEALKCCDEVLRLEPTNANATVLRAWLNRDRNPEAAKGEFRRGFSRVATMTFDEMPLTPSSPALSAF
jgi:tetratricopeptide (TPR) repeat protein